MDAAGRAKHALAEMQIELQNMLDAINTDRSARGVAPLDVTLPEGFRNEPANHPNLRRRPRRRDRLLEPSDVVGRKLLRKLDGSRNLKRAVRVDQIISST